jgi:glycosyltransferase involved in cell wall biosynthesis
VAERI